MSSQANIKAYVNGHVFRCCCCLSFSSAGAGSGGGAVAVLELAAVLVVLLVGLLVEVLLPGEKGLLSFMTESLQAIHYQ